jgi:phosphotriesterase-related protein
VGFQETLSDLPSRSLTRQLRSLRVRPGLSETEKPKSDAGSAQTVLGPVPHASLGPTLMHEHLLLDIRCWHLPPQTPRDRARAERPLKDLNNLGWVRYNWFAHPDNLVLDDIPQAKRELRSFSEAGGGTLVEVTPIDVGRRPETLAQIAEASGVNIIMGTGFYVNDTHPPELGRLSVTQLARRFIREITSGVGKSGIKAGIIGEIGCSWPIMPRERKVLRASALAQRETGAPITIHPGRSHHAPLEILTLLDEFGADLTRVVMGHMDARLVKRKDVLGVARSGCVMEWDTFGNETSYFPLADIDMPSDGQRLDMIQYAIERGFGERIVVSHDICSKHRLLCYGGYGYSHILENIVPRMQLRGWSERQIAAITKNTPASLLTFL